MVGSTRMVIGKVTLHYSDKPKQNHVQIGLSACSFSSTTDTPSSGREWTFKCLSEFCFCLPTGAQENCFKKNIKIYIKTAPTRFDAITIIRERLFRAC
jgi:hypothetical protein